MIGKLTGRFEGGEADGVAIIEVMGVGYSVRVPLGALEAMQRSGFADIALFIFTAVRDDAIDLYGFPTQEELSFFKQLMSVSGIGPKSALAILNVSDVSTLKRGIARGDAASLTKVFGIGKKSAERIVVELRDKVALEAGVKSAAGAAFDSDDGEVIEALMTLGYSASEARLAVREMGASAGSPREKITAALKILGNPAKAL
ncbi:MAG: Holliday junction branch migration protein RuvA [Chthoniobacterales bacterium]